MEDPSWILWFESFIPYQDYLTGHIRGTLRRSGGSRYVSDNEHSHWIGLIGDPDPAKKDRGIGFRDGLNGIDPMDHIREVQKAEGEHHQARTEGGQEATRGHKGQEHRKGRGKKDGPL